MGSGRKRLPPPVNAKYVFGQVIVLHAEDELIQLPHRLAKKAAQASQEDDPKATESRDEPPDNTGSK